MFAPFNSCLKLFPISNNWKQLFDCVIYILRAELFKVCQCRSSY